MTSARPLWKDPAALEARLRAVQPAVRLVSERRIRRVLAALAAAGDRRADDTRLPVWVGRDQLISTRMVEQTVTAGGEPRLVLLTQPEDRLLARRPDAVVLAVYERLLFRAAVADRLRSHPVEPPALPEPVEREVRFVLRSDEVVPAGASAAEVWAAFAGVYLETLAFDPAALPDVFPLLAAVGLPAPDFGIDWRRLREDVRLCPPPAPAADEPAGATAAAADGDEERAAAAGNFVRAAILRTGKAARTGGRERDRHWKAAAAAIRSLVAGLAAVCRWPARTADAWTDALVGLLPAAAVGRWPAAARALYDLQRLVADLGRPVYAVDPVGWLTSLGRRPLRVSLAHARDVLLLRHLGRAETHLLRVPTPEADRAAVLSLLHAEMHAAEGRVRATLGPRIAAALDASGLTPANRVERVARDKVVAELLDAACEKGFLRISDLRDALARNQLKLPDLGGPGELVRGDPVLRADRRLADALYGVYHRGEAYLRLIQRLTAVAFGTPAGRLVTLYAALPLLVAVLTLGFAQELVHIGHAVGDRVEEFIDRLGTPEPDADDYEFIWDSPPPHHAGFKPLTPTNVVALSLVVLLLLHAPAVRLGLWHAARLLGWAVRVVFLDVPRAVWRSPPLRRLWTSVPVTVFRRYVLLPLAIATAAALAVGLRLRMHPAATARLGGLLFAALAVFLNSPPGRRLREEAAEAWFDGWRYVRGNVIPGVYSALVWAFRALAAWVEKTLYAADEWLRYRDGQRRELLWLKAAAALVWFPLAYLVRFAFYLLFEPQVNPIKHFPVVTVSHKLLIPLVPSVAGALNVAEPTAFTLVACVPGVFGFLAWEVKENWRLYAANRPDALRPLPLGHHGETVRGLLRPGFHAGTVPKLFRKLRAAAGRPGGRPAAASRAHHDLDHIREAVRRMVGRELLPLWAGTPGLADRRPAVGGVTLGCQRIEVTLTAGPADPLVVAFENVDGEVVGTVAADGWLKALDPAARAAAGVGLAGLFALAAAPRPAAAGGPVRADGEVDWAGWAAAWGG